MVSAKLLTFKNCTLTLEPEFVGTGPLALVKFTLPREHAAFRHASSIRKLAARQGLQCCVTTNPRSLVCLVGSSYAFAVMALPDFR